MTNTSKLEIIKEAIESIDNLKLNYDDNDRFLFVTDRTIMECDQFELPNIHTDNISVVERSLEKYNLNAKVSPVISEYHIKIQFIK